MTANRDKLREYPVETASFTYKIFVLPAVDFKPIMISAFPLHLTEGFTFVTEESPEKFVGTPSNKSTMD